MPDESQSYEMRFDANQAPSGDGGGKKVISDSQGLKELRRIIIGSEGDRVADLEARLKLVSDLRAQGQVEAMSRALPQAIQLHDENNAPLSRALSTSVENALTQSVRRNPQPIVDAIFPVIGPAIRRSIKEALKSVMDSMNRTLEHSLSVKSIRWRMEAARTGKPFSEVVLAHTLSYRVEQLFLIDRKSGVPIHHLIADTVEAKDGDIVSGMLNAIQEFVRDSLGASREDVLESLEIGELEILVEAGPKAILAAVIRGIPTLELRKKLKEIIEGVHHHHSDLLDAFNGDSEPCAPMLPLLGSGLLARFKAEESSSKALWIIIGLLTVAFLFWFVLSFINYLRWNDYLDVLKQEPGIIVTDTGWRGGKWTIEGLRDPLARNPASLVPETLPPDRIAGKWNTYMALDPEIVTRRATRYLNAPEGVVFSYSGDTLFAAGNATDNWKQQARLKAPFLAASGVYDDSRVRSDVEGIESLVNGLEEVVLFFSQGDVLTANQEALIDQIAESIKSLQLLEERPFRVLVRGYASSEGSPQTNVEVSLQRAEAVQRALVNRGIPIDLLHVEGTGAVRIPESAGSEADRAANRSVAFLVELQQG